MSERVMSLSAATAADSGSPPRTVARLTSDMVRLSDDAWNEFHALFFDRLLRYALKLHRGDTASAEDSVQSGFLRAVKNIRTFDCEDALWSWLTLLVRCAAADQGRRLAVRSRMHQALASQADLLTARSHRPEELSFILLEEAVARLDESEQALLSEKYELGRSTAELAASREVSTKAIENRLRRLRQHLKSRIHALAKNTRL